MILKDFVRGIFAKRLEVQKLVLRVLLYGKDSKERPYSCFGACLTLTLSLRMADLQRSIAFLNQGVRSFNLKFVALPWF